MSLLKCRKCGEMFSDSYKSCPFCAEDEEYYNGKVKKRNHRRMEQKHKAPSIVGPVLVLVIILILAAVVWTVFGDSVKGWFDGRQLLSLFIERGQTDAAQALDIAFRYLLTMSSSLIILYLIYAYRSALQSMGSSIPSMISGFTECGARVLVAKGLYAWFGQSSLFFAEPVAWLGSLVYIMGSYYVLRKRYISKL